MKEPNKPTPGPERVKELRLRETLAEHHILTCEQDDVLLAILDSYDEHAALQAENERLRDENAALIDEAWQLRADLGGRTTDNIELYKTTKELRFCLDKAEAELREARGEI